MEWMTGAVLHKPGDLRIEKVKKPEIEKESKDVIVRVKAAGICGSDPGRVMVTGTYHFPTIPGHEFCGVVEEAGEQASWVKKGMRVLVIPILPCFQCDSCQEGNYGQCDSYNYLGSRTDGGFAEYVKVPERNLIPLPESISFLEGAAVEPAAVTLHGIMRVDVRPGDRVVVLGCGTIGTFAVQLVKILGSTSVIAVDIDDDKLDFARKFGADIVINGMKEPVIEKIQQYTNQKGADIVIETAGTSMTQVQAIEACKKHGQLLYLGTAHRDVVIPPSTFEHIIRREIRITGAWNSYSAPFPGKEWYAVLDYVMSGKLDIRSGITHTFSLHMAPKIIRDMAERKFSYNKVILVMD